MVIKQIENTVKKVILILLFPLFLVSQENNYSMSFDGVDDYIDFGSNLNFTDDFTISVWIKTDSVGTDGFNPIFYKDIEDDCYGLPESQIEIYLGNSGLNIAINRFADTDYQNINAWHGMNIPVTLEANTWINLAVVYNSNCVSAYIDGQELSLANATVSEITEWTFTPPDQSSYEIDTNGNNCDFIAIDTTVNYPATLGNSTNCTLGDDSYFYGFMDDLHIWDIALSEYQINNYLTCPPTGNEAALIGYWNFEEGEGIIANDIASGNNGTISDENMYYFGDTPDTYLTCTNQNEEENNNTLNSLVGDVNCDGDITIDDLQLLSNIWNNLVDIDTLDLPCPQNYSDITNESIEALQEIVDTLSANFNNIESGSETCVSLGNMVDLDDVAFESDPSFVSEYFEFENDGFLIATLQNTSYLLISNTNDPEMGIWSQDIAVSFSTTNQGQTKDVTIPVQKGQYFIYIGYLPLMKFIPLECDELATSSSSTPNSETDSIYQYGYIQFDYTGAPQMFVIPDNVYKLEIECYGAGAGDPNNNTRGNGGYISGEYYCSPGDTLYIYVGGENNNGYGGWNGGGNSIYPVYNHYDNVNNLYYNYGGGGGTDVRLEYGGQDGSANLESRIITAGGGSGSGGDGGNNIIYSNSIAYGAGSTSQGYNGSENGGSAYANEWYAYGGGAGLFSPGLSGGSEYTYPSTSGTWWPEYVCFNEQPNPCSEIFENINCGPIGNSTTESQGAVYECYQLLLNSYLTDGEIWKGGDGIYGAGGGQYGGGSSVSSGTFSGTKAAGGSSYANPDYFSLMKQQIVGGVNSGNGKVIISW